MLLSKETPDGKAITLMGIMQPGPLGLNYMLYTVIMEQDVIGKGLRFDDAKQIYDKLGGE